MELHWRATGDKTQQRLATSDKSALVLSKIHLNLAVFRGGVGGVVITPNG
jgi:hypothetical protein